jgi:predicted RNA-binding protein with PUA-like domain
MAFWIFQADPKRYRLLDALVELDEIVWQVNQHQREIHPGDKVFIWQAGSDGGIYGIGEVTTEPAPTPTDDPYWVEAEKERMTPPRTGVKLKIIKRLVDHPLLKSQLREDPSLDSLSILKLARGTNFPVSTEEWTRLEELLGLEAKPPGPPEQEVSLDVAETHLRQALARDLNQVEPGLVALFAERVEEYPIPGGRIDLLCKDHQETPVVIELKRHHWDTDKAIGQIARYMGWVKRTLTEDGSVRGILLVLEEGEPDPRLEDAAAAVPGLEVKRYSISFRIA